MKINEIKNLRRTGNYDAALSGCLELLRFEPENLEVMRLSASIYALKKNYSESFLEYKKIIEYGSGRIGDYYLASDVALLLNEYEQAKKWLERVIKIGNEIEDDAFESAAHFLLAYTYMQTRNFDKAIQSLEAAILKDPGISLPLPGEAGLASALHMRNEIQKRKSAHNR